MYGRKMPGDQYILSKQLLSKMESNLKHARL